jgi:DNA replication ATP-dependent helicase Dna2
VLSLVKSNGEGDAGKLLQDWRRINVAITRAKRKLLLLGDAATLRSIPLFARLLDLVRQHGWYLPLPPNALAGLG